MTATDYFSLLHHMTTAHQQVLPAALNENNSSMYLSVSFILLSQSAWYSTRNGMCGDMSDRSAFVTMVLVWSFKTHVRVQDGIGLMTYKR